jgi:uncharacterized protein (TIGR02996 family)
MEAEEHAMIAAIIARPEDDTPRLAYADWLDEHCREFPPSRRESARGRAELIRLEVEHTREVVGKGDRQIISARAKRIDELKNTHYNAWLNELARVAPCAGMSFKCKRGLFEEVCCSVKTFVSQGVYLFEQTPLASLRLLKLTTRNVASLAKCPHFAKLRTLKISVADHLEPIAQLLKDWPLDHLRGLVLDSSNIDLTTDEWFERADPIAARLAEKTWSAGGLKRLVLAGAGVGGEGGRALAQSASLAKLETLDLRHNPGLGASRESLRERFGSRVWLDHDDLQGLTYGFVYPD